MIRMLKMGQRGKRKRGRPKRRFVDAVKEDMRGGCDSRRRRRRSNVEKVVRCDAPW